MKNIKGILAIIMALNGINVFCQDINVSSIDACYEGNTGSITVDFEQYAVDYMLPFVGNYYNLTTGDYEEITIESTPFILNNLSAGIFQNW